MLGLLLQDQIDQVFRDLRLTALALIVFGLVLGWADWYGRRERDLDDLTTGHGITYGFAQAMALIPGVSRSGGTLTAGRLLGYNRSDAAEYGFLLAVPAVFGSSFYKLADIGTGAGPAWGPTLLATVIAFVVGYAVVAWLMSYLKRHSFLPFVAYRVALGLVLLALVASGHLTPDAGPSV